MSRTGRHQFAAASVELLLKSFGGRQSGGVRDRVQSAACGRSPSCLKCPVTGAQGSSKRSSVPPVRADASSDL
jgi:hypothetical protein